MIAVFERIYMTLCEKSENPEYQYQYHFIESILINHEIKMKLCERLLINCRFNDESNNNNNCLAENSVLFKSHNPNDNNEIVFRIISHKLLVSLCGK